MRTRTLTAAAATLGAVATFLIPAAASAAATTVPHFTGYAGGTYAYAANGAVVSGLTAASGLDTISTGQASTNNVAKASIPGVLAAGAVTSSMSSAAVSGGVSVTAHARTVGLSLLGGLISADVVDTSSTATLTSKPGSSISTTLTNLSINNAGVPIRVPANTTITIPGIASVVVNWQATIPGDRSVITGAAALLITLLGKSGNAAPNTIIEVNPVNATIDQVVPAYAPLGGYADAANVSSNVGDALNIQSGLTGASYMPTTGTGGKDVTNATGAVTLPGLATIGAARSMANGSVTSAASHGTLTANVANIKLLGGAITADAITATAEVSKVGSSAPIASGSASFVNLKVGGVSVPANAPANTVIKLGNVGTVTVNARYFAPTASVVRGLEIHLTTAAYGLPANATVFVAEAFAYFRT